MRYGSSKTSQIKTGSKIKLGLEDRKLDNDIFGNYDPTKLDEEEKNDSCKSLDENIYLTSKNSLNESGDVHCYSCTDLISNDTVKSSHAKLKKCKGKAHKGQMTVCLTNCKYSSVQKAVQMHDFKEVGELDDWNILWSDTCIHLVKMMEMSKYQKINHFPGMLEICRKDLLARNLKRALKLFPKDFNFFPKTFYLPADYSEFQSYSKHRKKAVFILKPENSCQGKGIRLVRNSKAVPYTDHVLCQQYLSKPFLIDGLKFDFRIYVLVTSCDPFRIFVYNEGLARFATVPYAMPNKNNLENIYMHLTNYSINKKSKDFIRDDCYGNKRKVTSILEILWENGYDVSKMLSEVDDIVIKTFISINSVLKRNHSSVFLKHDSVSACFELLGFDILLDKDLRPYLLEVNHSPSFSVDSALDKAVKEALLCDTFSMVTYFGNYTPGQFKESKNLVINRLRKSREMQAKLHEEGLRGQVSHEESRMGNFRLIYPSENSEKYQRFYNTAPLVYQDTKASKSRAENARLFREKLDSKQVGNKTRGESPKRLKLNKSLPPVTPIETLKACDILVDDEKRRMEEMGRRNAQMRMYGIVGAVKKLFSLINQPSSHSLPPINLQVFNFHDKQDLGNVSTKENVLLPFGKHILNSFNPEDDEGSNDDDDDYSYNCEVEDILDERFFNLDCKMDQKALTMI